MKYSLELVLNQSRAEVWKIFADPNHTHKWQPALVNIELLNGTAGQPGAVAKLNFKSGDREFSLTETITLRTDPERLDGLYENEFAHNLIRNTFLEQDASTTLWKVTVEFKFKTLLMHILGPFVKKRFVANTQKDMARFKALVEKSEA